MKTTISMKSRNEMRGVALPLMMLVLLVIALAFSLAIDRTVAESGEVVSFYYDGVALDLAEGGVAIAGRRIASGSALFAGKSGDTIEWH